MIFTVRIDGNDINLSNAFLWQIKYKSQFKEDPAYFLLDAMQKAESTKDRGNNEDVYAALKSIGFVRMSGMIWAMAKAADNSIPAPAVWQAQFNDFPILDIGLDALAYAIDGITGSTEKPKNANAPGTAQNPANG